MKRIVLLLLGLLLALPQFAQERKYSTFYEQRATLFEELPVTSKDIIFLGNSITNGCEWAELFQNKNVKNRGISGDICMGVYDRLDPIVKGKPAKIFLLIGINDVSRGTSADKIISEISMIVRKIKQESPKTKLSGPRRVRSGIFCRRSSPPPRPSTSRRASSPSGPAGMWCR